MQTTQQIQTTHKKRNAFLALVTLTLQNAMLAVSMPYASRRPGDIFITSTAVFIVEFIKLAVNLVLIYKMESTSWKHFVSMLDKTIIKKPLDTLNVCITSLVYVIQNNMLFVATSNLDAATCQITLQLKIFTTAIFSVILLKRKLFRNQWAALALLIIGVTLVQLNDKTDQTQNTHIEQNKWIGLMAALITCVLSGLAGVYFEKVLKGAEISLWIRNVQLSVVAIPLSFIVCLKDWKDISNKGFFYGYDLFIVYLICLQAAGGLIVAIVIKYADNILKGFATSISIIVACSFSMYFFGLIISIQFFVGTLFVFISIFCYSYNSDNTQENKSPNSNTV